MTRSRTKPKKSPTGESGQGELSTSVLTKKELTILRRKARRQWQDTIKTTIGIGTIAILIAIPLLFVGGPKLAVAGGGGVFVLALSYQYPNQALWVLLLYLPINGTVTYAIGGGSPIFQLAKDAFYFPALMALIPQWQKNRLPILLPKRLKLPLSILLIFCAITWIFVNGSQELCINPSELSEYSLSICQNSKDKPLLLGLLGLKVFLGYIPLITCAYHQIKSKENVLFITRIQLSIIIFCCICGVIQYYLLETGRCVGTRNLFGEELYKASLSGRCIFGGAVAFSPQVNFIRLPGTFVAPWQWAWFLISGAFFTFASTFYDPKLWWRLGGLIGMILVLTNAIISGQRIALAVVPIVLLILLICTGQIAKLKKLLPIFLALCLILGLIVSANPEFVETRLKSFVDRWQAAPPSEFILQQFTDIYDRQESILGKGLGRATNSARMLGQTELVETYYAKIFYEIGPFGTLAFVFLATNLIIAIWQAYRRVKDPHLSGFGAAFGLFVLLISYNTYWYPLDTDPVAVYYWYFAGVALKLPEIDTNNSQYTALRLRSGTA